MLSNKIQNIYTDIQNDPITRKKFIFYTASGVTLIALIFLLLFLSSLSETNKNKIQTSQLPTEITDNSLASKFLNTQINSKQRLAKIYSSGGVLIDSKGNFIYKDLTEYPGLNVYPATTYTIRSIFDIPKENIAILNKNNNTSYLFQGKELKFYPTNILSVTPITTESSKGIYTIKKTSTGVFLSKYDNLDLSGFATDLAEIKSDYTFIEVVSINTKPYVLVWNNNDLDILALNGSNLVSIKYIQNLESFNINNKYILYTTKDNSNNKKLIDFSSTESGNTISLNIDTKLSEMKISGKILAPRCVVFEEYSITCLVKEGGSDVEDSSVRDYIIKYNYITQETNKIHENLKISADRIYVDELNQMYILESTEKYIWSLK